jgi:hypothetical protein
MKRFSEDFLRKICEAKVLGDFEPFKSGKIKDIEKYIKRILGDIKAENKILSKADFNSYGSGFASYVDVSISKQDKSDTRFIVDGNKKTEWTKGLSLYISKLCPFWFIGGSEWTVTRENEKWIGGSSGFLRPESVRSIDNALWQAQVERIKKIFGDFGYSLLSEEDVSEPLWFDINIPTILADRPYQVFDCFFYWED